MAMPKRTGMTAVIALVVLVAATWIRVVMVNALPDQGFFAKYTEIATEILSGHIPLDRLGDLSTGYLWLIVLGLGPLGLDAVALRTVQIIGVSLAAAVCGAGAWKRWGLAAGVGTGITLLASRAALVNATEIEPETAILCLTSVGLGLLVASNRPHMRAASGLALGLAVVTRPSILLPAFLLVLGLVWRTPRRQRLPAAIPLIIGMAIPVAATRLAVSSLTGAPPTPMNPGTVFSEGWNPMATGYQGEAPVVVKDVEHTLALPDGLHVAYRLVAARATGQPASPGNSNAYWAKRAFAFIRHEPAAVLNLGLRKAMLSCHSYDAWDLKTLQRKAENLARGPFVPFAFLAALGCLGLFFGRRDPAVPVLGLWIFGGWSVMTLFYVTARQRNVLLPAVALLAGAALPAISATWRSGRRRLVTASLVAAVFCGLLLSVEGPAQREDRHGWDLLAAQEGAVSAAEAAPSPDESALWQARAATFLDPVALREAAPRHIDLEIRTQLSKDQPPQRLFDLALVMIEIGQWEAAEPLLRSLQASGYQPRRGGRWCSSVAYHLSRCRLMASDFPGARRHLSQAFSQAPGDPRILAMHAVLSDLTAPPEDGEISRARLQAMFDPFTGNLAMAAAYSDAGRSSDAALILTKIRDTLPEWIRPEGR